MTIYLLSDSSDIGEACSAQWKCLHVMGKTKRGLCHRRGEKLGWHYPSRCVDPCNCVSNWPSSIDFHPPVYAYVVNRDKKGYCFIQDVKDMHQEYEIYDHAELGSLLDEDKIKKLVSAC